MTEIKPVALVIGDVMLDRWSEGDMLKVSAEAPVPVVRQTREYTTLGGAGNVAVNIRALGHDVMLLGVIGHDAAGEDVTAIAVAEGLQWCLPYSADAPTIVKHRITCGAQAVARLDIESAQGISNDEHVIANLRNVILAGTPVKIVVVADYEKGTMTPAVVAAVRQLCHEQQIPIFVDCRPGAAAAYHGVTLLKPNMREALGMLAADVHPGLMDTEHRSSVACQQLAAAAVAQLVVVTDGSRGSSYTDPDDNGMVHSLAASGPAGVDIVKDICGAGDTVMAGLTAGYLEGMSFSHSVLFAMQCAGVVVQHYGVYPARRDEVDEFISQLAGVTGKSMSAEAVVSFVARKRRLQPNCRIVFTNGCYDGFHAGHLETLRFAATQGDVLIVAYNDDTSLIAVKGPDRPHVPDSYRASHLAAQEPVDAIFRFDGDVEKVVRAIKPDVLVKGADAGVTRIPGEDFVAAHGGRVELCPIDSFYVTVDRQSQFTPPDA